MSLLVVVLLGALWASILLPGVLRARRGVSPLASVDRFERSMGLLARTRSTAADSGKLPGRRVLVLDHPAEVVRGDVRTRAARRRRTILVRLVAATVASGGVAAVAGGWLWWAFWSAAAALGVYLGLLVHLAARRDQRGRTVRDLGERRSRPPLPLTPARPAVGQVSGQVPAPRWEV